VEKNSNLLRSLGFTKEESVIYLFLIEEPEGKSLEEIVEQCKFTSLESEKAIARLVENNALRVISNRFEAINPENVLEDLVKDRIEKAERNLNWIRRTTSVLKKTLEPIYWEKRLGIRPYEILEPLENLREMELRTIRIIGNSKDTIIIFAATFDWYEKVREEILSALDRGVKIKILMLVVEKNTAKRAEDLKQIGVEVRHCVETWYPVRGTLSDNTELVFLIWATKKEDIPRPIHYRPHYTTNPGLIRVFKDSFEKRWEEANLI
jgi:sugar-specific transcriptional regulator TrmB